MHGIDLNTCTLYTTYIVTHTVLGTLHVNVYVLTVNVCGVAPHTFTVSTYTVTCSEHIMYIWWC